MTLAFHPFADLFPLIEGADFDALVADIRVNGLREPIVLLLGQILDGRNRYRAALAADVKPTFVAYEGDDPLAFVISKNLQRRHLNDDQRRMIAAQLVSMGRGRPSDNPADCGIKVAEAARLVNTDEAGTERARTVLQKAAPEVQQAVKAGKLTVNAAVQAVGLPKKDQREIAKLAEAGNVSAARTIIKQGRRETKEAELAERQTALPEKRYGVILADPEWQFEPWSRKTGLDRSADNHYPTSATEVIAARPVEKIAADDCILFLWATAPMLPHALLVMGQWGFDYRTHIIWRKAERYDARPVLGTGYWFRNGHELLLVGVRGNVPAPAPGTQWPSLFDSGPRKHSQKPDEVYTLVEEYFPNLPKIELNARAARAGWAAWGNEAPPHDADTGEIIEDRSAETTLAEGTALAEPAADDGSDQILSRSESNQGPNPDRHDDHREGVASRPSDGGGTVAAITESEAAGQAVVTAGTATSPVIAGDDVRRKVPMAGGFDRDSTGAVPEPAPNGGGGHVATDQASPNRTTGAGDGENRPPAPDYSGFELPSFLKRGDPDCIVKAAS